MLVTKYRHAVAALRSDRGDSDPVLTIASVFLSALVSAAVLGLMIMLIGFGGNFVKEQTRAASLSTAKKMWAQDANDASIVAFPSMTDVVFYDMPGKHPGVYQEKGTGASTDVACRKSEWVLSGSTLTDTVSQFPASDPVCDWGDASVKPASAVKVVTVSGLDAGAHIAAVNAAGRDLHFVDGAEVGLSATAGPGDKSVNSRAPWWRDYEWDYTQPATVDLVATTTMPVSGHTTADLAGTTWNRPTPAGATDTSGEPVPTPATYAPGPVAFTITRSSTIGASYGGFHEGVMVNITTPASCGPYSVQYDLSWTPSTPGAPDRSTSLTTFTSPAPVDFDQVPNGVTGTMQVTASCPPSVQDGPDTVTSQDYTQPLPAPVLTVTADPVTPNVHTLAWAPVSSMASVGYDTQMQQGDAGAWVDQQQALPNPDPTAGKTIAWPLGSTYGQQMNYRVIPQLASTIGATSNEAGVLTPWPAITGIDWASHTSTGLNLTTVLTTYDGCPAGTSAEYRQRVAENEGPWQTWSAWGSTPSSTVALAQGMKAQINGDVHCAYNTAQYSPASSAPEFDWVQPITTAPGAPAITASNPDFGATATVSWSTTGCPTNTTPRFQWQWQVTTNGAAGPWSGFTGWSAATSGSVPMDQGAMLAVQVKARCVSPYTWDTAPAGYLPAGQTNGPAGPTNTMSGWVRPIAQAAAPGSIWSDAGGPSAPVNNRFLWSAIGCPAGTSPVYARALNGAWYGDWATGTAQNAAVGWGASYTGTVSAACQSAYTQGPGSGNVATSWITNVPAVTGLWNNVNPSSTYTYDSIWVSAGSNGCPAGTTTHYYTDDGYGDRYYGSGFSDSWRSAGWKTYSTYAYCQGPAASGPVSGPAKASVNILNPPPPAAPLISSTSVMRGNSGGGSVSITFNAVAGADQYEIQGFLNDAFGKQFSNDQIVTSAGSYNAIAGCGIGTNIVTGSGQVRAHNSSGWGPWSSTGDIPASRGMSCF